METVTRTAFDPETGQEYEIEMPAPEEVSKGILELEFPPEGILVKDAVDPLVNKFQLSDEQRNAKYKSGSNVLKVFHIAVVWRAFTRLVGEGKLVQPGGPRTPFFLSESPSQTLISDFTSIPNSSVTIEEEERTSQTSEESMAANYQQSSEGSEQDNAIPRSAVGSGNNPVEEGLSLTAEESIETNYQQIQDALAADLLEKIKSKSPAFFEELVIDLLVAMDYGGSREDAEAVGRSGDGGIDGIINEDRLGLDVVYVQAKRWADKVSRPEIQKFAGALQGQRARKGVFITTSDFTREARDYVTTIDSKIVLIDGHQLAQFMIDYNVGVSVAKSYEIKRVDSDYFAEEGE